MSTMNFEILFDGEMVAEESSSSLGAHGGSGDIIGTADFQGGDKIRCTVNGVSVTFIAHQDSLGGYFGNYYLLNTSYPDTGYDYYFGSVTLMEAHAIEVYTRTPGTYTVKLEIIRANLPEYSYNGTILGALPPDWDKENYPYAYITHYENDRYLFYAYATLPTFSTGSEGELRLVWERGAIYQSSNVYTDLSLWWEDAKNGTVTTILPTIKPTGQSASGVLWSNFDILNTDGSVYLAASDPIQVKSHVTESSGDGYALYNGVKLRNIESVLTDKETYQFSGVGQNVSTGVYVVSFSSSKCYRNTSDDTLRTSEETAFRQYHFDGTDWVLDHEVTLPAGYNMTTLSSFKQTWVNYDLLNDDDTTYLAASDPIPLDGMTVIEWDGVTEGLESVGNLYRVADYVPGTSAVAVLKWFDPVAVYDTFISNELEWSVDAGGTAPLAYASESAEYDGIYLLNVYSGDAYVPLLAYTPAAVDTPTTLPAYDPTSMLLGWMVGRTVAGQRGKQTDAPVVPDEPSGIYDDEWPIEWNALAVAGNTAVDVGDGYFAYKVSDLTPDASDLGGTLTVDGTALALAGAAAVDVGAAAIWVSDDSVQVTAISVTTAGDSSDLGWSFPETGLYVTWMGLPEDCTFTLERGQAITITDTSITWTGNTYDLESVECAPFDEGTVTYYKITDWVPSDNLSDYTKIASVSSNSGYTETDISDEALEGNSYASWYKTKTTDGLVLVFSICSIIVITVDSYDINGTTFTKGVWMNLSMRGLYFNTTASE